MPLFIRGKSHKENEANQSSQPEKSQKSKNRKKKQAQPIHFNTFLYVKKQNRLCGNGNFFVIPHVHVCFSFSLENQHKVANST